MRKRITREQRMERKRNYHRIYYLTHPELKEVQTQRARKYRQSKEYKIKQREHSLNYYYANKSKCNAKAKLYVRNIRLKLVSLLGNKCIKCGFSDIRALQIDHIDGKGRRDVKERGGGKRAYIYYSKNIEEAKKKLQVLCANCNWIKRYEMKEGWTG